MWKPTNEEEEDDQRWSPPAQRRQASPQKRSPVKRQASPGPAARMSPGPDNGVPDGAANARLDDACTTCGRKMAGTALDRMERIHGQRCCPKCAPKKQRKTFNMAAKRADGFDGDERRKVLDGAKQVKKELRAKKSFGGSSGKEGKWKAQSNQLREAMANMRAITKAENLPEPELPMLFDKVLAPRRMPPPPPAPGSRAITYTEALREAIAQAIESDDTVFLMGEDVGPVGGTFGVTRGLFDRFGPERVMNTPISEGVISGSAVGAALSGRRPIAEIQIFDFVTFMMDPIVNQAAKLRFMLGGKASVPVVFRGPQGGGIRLAAQHSQSLEAWFAHVPGLTVLAPSTAYDAKGLMIAAIRDDNPVVFLEHKLLYLGGASPVPEAPYEIEIGKADVKREGTDITIIATLAMVERALSAAETLAREGISVEVIDPRSLRPLDMECFVRSVKKTSRCLVVHEAWRTGGIGAEIAAQITEEAFDWLDAPAERMGAAEVPMPYNDRLEREVMPSAAGIAETVRRMCHRDLAEA